MHCTKLFLPTSVGVRICARFIIVTNAHHTTTSAMIAQTTFTKNFTMKPKQICQCIIKISIYITMAVDIPLTLMKTAAITGIGLVWANFTVKAFKMGWHIISTSLDKKEILSIKEIVMCENCQKHFLDDGNELVHERFLCEDCRN